MCLILFIHSSQEFICYFCHFSITSWWAEAPEVLDAVPSCREERMPSAGWVWSLPSWKLRLSWTLQRIVWLPGISPWQLSSPQGENSDRHCKQQGATSPQWEQWLGLAAVKCLPGGGRADTTQPAGASKGREAQQPQDMGSQGGLSNQPRWWQGKVPDWGWCQGKADTCTIEVKTVAGESTSSKRPISLAWKKKGLIGKWTHPKCEKAPSQSHIKAYMVPREQETCPLAYHSCLWPGCTHTMYLPVLSIGHMALAATWPMASKRELLSLSLLPT